MSVRTGQAQFEEVHDELRKDVPRAQAAVELLHADIEVAARVHETTVVVGGEVELAVELAKQFIPDQVIHDG
jgi:hypothetical protein